MHVTIRTKTLPNTDVAISETAAELIGVDKNPHSDPRVETIKSLASALVSICEDVRDNTKGAGRRASIAITQIETFAMFAVKAATTSPAGRSSQ